MKTRASISILSFLSLATVANAYVLFDSIPGFNGGYLVGGNQLESGDVIVYGDVPKIIEKVTVAVYALDRTRTVDLTLKIYAGYPFGNGYPFDLLGSQTVSVDLANADLNGVLHIAVPGWNVKLPSYTTRISWSLGAAGGGPMGTYWQMALGLATPLVGTSPGTYFMHKYVPGTYATEWVAFNTSGGGVTFGNYAARVETIPMVSGNVNVGGGRPISTIDIQFRNPGTTTAVGPVVTVPVDANGDYFVRTPGRAAANFDVTVKPAGFLRRTINANATSGNAINANFNLVPGDIVPDNVIDLTDYTALVAYFNSTSAGADWNTPDANGIRPSDADINGDGVVDLTDYTVIAVNFNAIGDQ